MVLENFCQLEIKCPPVFLALLQAAAVVAVDIGRLLVPGRPNHERQTDQLAQVTLANRCGVAFLARSSRWGQLSVPHQDGGGGVDLRVDCIDGVGSHVWKVSPIVGNLLLAKQL